MPTINPPRPLTARPGSETPPLVPLGTLFSVVTRMGSDLASTVPSSLARVSPSEQENAPEIDEIKNESMF